MTTVEPWQVLAAVGFLLAIFEFFTPTFFFLPAGIALLVTAVIAVVIRDWTAILLILAVNLGIVYWVFHSYLWPRLKKTAPKTNADAMAGKIGVVTEDVNPETGSGYVKLYGDTWRVVAKDVFPKGAKVKIEGTEGNRVIIRALQPGEE